jgi:hypothetical protein
MKIHMILMILMMIQGSHYLSQTSNKIMNIHLEELQKNIKNTFSKMKICYKKIIIRINQTNHKIVCLTNRFNQKITVSLQNNRRIGYHCSIKIQNWNVLLTL